MVELILHYRRVARHALNVLWGAVEVTPATAHLPSTAVEGTQALENAVRAALRAGRTPVVAWSFYSSGFAEAAAELAAHRRRTGPGAVHLAGGPHASAAPAEVLRAGFDLVAVGEGEETLPAVLHNLGSGRGLAEVPGLAWLEQGAVRRTGRARPVDLDRFPPCAPLARRIGPIEITRGCPFGCRFCQTPFLFRARFRHRSLAEVRRWIRFHRDIATRDLRFLTPSALSWGSPGEGCDLDAIEALLAAAREEAGPDRRLFFGSFPSELRPEHVSPRALALIRRYCDNRTVILGAQSGSERMLRAMGRGHGVAEVLRAVALCGQAGLRASVDVMLGLPGESEPDRAATRDLLGQVQALGGRAHVHAFMPLPGSPWAGEPPGDIDPATRALLERMEAGGAAHGQWRRQRDRVLARPHQGRALRGDA
ncbi:MAG TPA: TIGR04013 family B12-binding domain/radical SAM domain-containing protein [Anaeromyxobacter sp.]|nr:TIGR04013 family B12-binding domain/radical SAM domain-containing protein [Anaeromyxobacter sp.]